MPYPLKFNILNAGSISHPGQHNYDLRAFPFNTVYFYIPSMPFYLLSNNTSSVGIVLRLTNALDFICCMFSRQKDVPIKYFANLPIAGPAITNNSMKINPPLPVAIAVLLFFFLSCKPKVDVEAEKQAIKTALITESQTWIHKDFAKAQTFYVQDSLNTRMNVDSGSYRVIKGWDRLKLNLDTVFSGDRAGIADFKIDKEFLNIKVMDNTAWVACRETNTLKYKGIPKKSVRLQLIVLQKIDGNWKVSSFFNSIVKP